AFVSFPNFAHWRVRLYLLAKGRMPVTRNLPQTWYDTPNIHHLTIADFRDLLDVRGVKVKRCWFLSRGKLISPLNANWRAHNAVFQVTR
ncbi:MAG: methionine biosynthesis protein MetW, partial [Novosphingobium sp.]|nr:methionine biosynthesis protein MetW [Novosphingobium sp.]